MDPLQKKKLNGLLLGSSCLVASAFIGALPALANPTGPHVVSGHDKVSTSGNTTTIDQTSQKGFIDWNSFSIGKGQTVQFVQPGKGSVTVNRVTGGDPSKILGELLANGGVWIINGNGILFGKGSIVNVGSLIATTSDLGDDDFKNGKYRFKKGSNPNASVINQGTITASSGGSVVLSAAHVANEGVIQANLGKVVLGGAAAFTVDLNGDNLIRYQITKPVSKTPTKSDGDPQSALVSNSGTIEANGGSVLMTSRAASNVQDNVINNSGIIEATSVHAHDGEVDLDADGGTVKDSGTVDVSGTQANQTGGDVTITGRKIVVADGAHIDAQGTDGGGTVLIGGNMHGEGKLEQAQKVVIGKAVIDADATSKGNGGKVGVWSKGETSIDGKISARGGSKGGNGGYVETSGHSLGMDASALVDTSAIKGIGGTWLLDPTDVVIDNCGGECTSGQIDATAIGNSLSAGTNVTVEAVGTGAGTGNITVTSSVMADGAGTLSLLATFDIDVQASIQNAGSGGINLVAGWDGTTGVSGTPATGESGSAVNIGTITSTPGAYGNNGGSVTIGNGYSSASVSVGSAGGTTTVAAGDLTVGVNGNATANAQLGYAGAGNAAGGDVNAVLSGDLLIQSDRGGISRIGNTGTTGAVTGNITISADNVTMQTYSGNSGQAVIGNSGDGAVSGNIAITTSGDLTMEAGKYGSSGTYVTIGNYTGANAGASGNIKVAVGGDISMESKYNGTTRIGSKSATANLNVTAAGNISMTTYGSESYNVIAIGNFGSAAGNAGGNITVTSTNGNITLALQTAGAVEIGNSAGVVVSGDVHVVAANGTVTVGNYYSSGVAQIGNNSGYFSSTNTMVEGNVTINAGAVSVISDGTNAFAQIGNYGGLLSEIVSGDVLVTSYGALSLNGAGGRSVWVGNVIGDGGAGAEVGNVTLVANSLSVTNGGDADDTTLGDMVASDLTGSMTTATSGTGGSGGGNVTIAITGAGTTDWGTYFGDGIDFSNGNTLSLITTGAQKFSTSIVANESGNINAIAGWDGTTGFGQTGINIGDILASQSAYGSAGGDITIGGTGDVDVGTAFGNTTVAGGNVSVSSLGTAQAVIGVEGPSSGNITVDATGEVAVSTINGGYAQIGNGGESEAGDAGGNITINAGGEVLLEAVNGDVQIGNGGPNSNGNFSGNIDVVAGGAVLVEAEDGYAQIGNGGANTNNGTGAGSDSGNITVQGASVSVSAGSGNGSYAQIGHGGAGSDTASGSSNTGNIDVVATDGDIVLTAGASGNQNAEQNDYAQIGMGGPFSGTDTSNKDTGNITLNATGNISILGGTDADQQNGFAIVGDTGTAQKSGNISVTAGDNIIIIGGSATGDPDFGGLSNSFAMIGDDNQGDVTANISVKAGGNLTLTGGGGNGNMAQIGSNGDSGNVTGNVKVTVAGTTTITSTTSAADAWIGDGYQESGTYSGTTTFITGDLVTSADSSNDLSFALGRDLVGGNVLVEITDPNADTTFAGVQNYDSASSFRLLAEGSLDITGGIQNSGSGAIYVIGGWDGTTTSASALTNTGVYGNNSGAVTIGGLDASSDVAVGSEGGSTTIAADDVNVDGSALGYAQIGYHGAGGGNIVVDATDMVSVESGGNSDLQNDAVIGNGSFDGNGTSGNATGNITVNAGSGGIIVEAANADTVAAIGNITDDSTSGEAGNISVSTTGTLLLSTPDAGSLAYIGNFSRGGTTGGASGNIDITAGTLDIENAGDDSESIIGNGGVIGAGATTVFTNAGAVTGDITINAGNVTLTASGNGAYGGQSRIADRGAGTVSGNISVTATGNMTLQTYAGDVASIGNSTDGSSSDTAGNITVTVGGDLSLLAQDTGESRIAAGQTADTNVDVNVTGDILMQVTGSPTTYAGEAVIGNFANGRTAASGNISVTSINGNITLDAAENYSFALIGNAIGTTVGGSVTVKAANGTITMEAPGAGALAQIGEFGQDSATGGDITVDAKNLVIDASGASAVAQIGNGSEGMQGDASGNISVVVSDNLTLEGGNGFTMIGNGDPFHTGTGGASGNITVSAGGTTTISDTNTTPNVWIGNLADTGTESGSVTFKTKDLNDSGDVPGDIASFVAADLAGGNVTLEFTDKTGTPTFGGIGDYDSANTLKILSEGNIDITGSLQNAGAGSIYVIGGWDGTTTQASKFTDAGVYGNNGGSITVGSGTGDAAIGSESGKTVFAADNIAVDAANGLAQIGWSGTGGGNVTVLASGNVTVESTAPSGCTDCTALIGNGGAGVNGTVTGDISVTTSGGSITLDALGAQATGDSIATIGNVGDVATMDGNVTVNTNGGQITMVANGTNSFAQIGSWSTDFGDTGSITSNITVDAGAISMTANGTSGSAMIGNGGYLGVSVDGALTGNITVDATTISMISNAGTSGFDEARVGNLGGGVVTGTVDVAATGNILLLGTGSGAASIGNFSSQFDSELGAYAQGEASGTVDVTSGGSITVESDDGYASIELGGAASGSVNVTAADNITETAINGGGALIGALASDNGGANVKVTAKTGNIDVESTGTNSAAQIGTDQDGFASGGDTAGNVTVTATLGDIIIAANNGGATQIGNIGDADAGNTVSGNILLTAGNQIDIETTADTLIGNTGASETGNVTIDADSLAGDISPSIGNDLGGGNFTVSLTGDQALTLATDIDVDTSNTLSLSNGGNIVFAGSIQNSGSGNITIDSQRTVTVGGTQAVGSVSVGTANGTLTVDGNNIVVEAIKGSAQLGFNGAGSGNIVIDATSGVGAGSNLSGAVGMIGNGGEFVSGNDSGNIAITAKNMELLAENGGLSQVGNGGPDGTGTATGNITIDLSNEFIAESIGTSSFVQLGNGGAKYQGNSSGDISLSAAAMLFADGSNNSIMQIGNGGYQSIGDASGNITITSTGNITAGIQANGTALQIGNGGDQSDGHASGNVTLDASGDLVLEMLAAGTSSYIQVGNGGSSAQGTAGGDVSVTGANISLTTDNPGYIQIGNGGSRYDGDTSGNITVDASANILADADINASYIQIGNGGDFSTGNDSGNIAVTAGSDLDLETTNSTGGAITQGSYVQVGNGGDHSNQDSANGFSETGTITVNANTIELTAGDDISGVLIGNGGTCAGAAGSSNANCSGLENTSTSGSIAFGGDITVTAKKSLTMTAEGTDDLIQIGNGSGDSASGANAGGSIADSGNITVTVGTANKAGTLTMIAGDEDLVHIGNGGFDANLEASADSGIAESGNVTVTVKGGANHGGVATLSANGANTDNAVIIGNDGGAMTAGTVSGDVDFTVEGAVELAAAAAGNTIIGDTSGVLDPLSGVADAPTGNVTITAQSMSGDIAQSIDNDLSHGNLTIDLLGDDIFAITSAAIYQGDHTLAITNGGGIVFDASVQNLGGGDIDVTSKDGDILIGGAGASGNVAVGTSFGGTDTFTADNLTLDAVNGSAEITSFAFEAENGSPVTVPVNFSGNISINVSGNVTLIGGSSASRLAEIGPGTSGSGGDVTIAAASLQATGDSGISGASADITISGNGDVGSSDDPLEFAVNDLAIQTNGGSVFATSSTQGVSLGVGSDGIDLNGGDFSLIADGAIAQTQAILAGSIDVAGSKITLTNTGNSFGDVTLDASGNASIFDSQDLVIASADSGGTLSLASGGDISQTGSIIAGTLDVAAKNGSVALDNAGNSFADASIKASGDASLFDATNLTVTGANVGGTLTLSGTGNIGQSGAIKAATLDVTANNGAIALTNSGNAIGKASLTSSGDASLTDASDLTITGASVGGTLTLTDAGSTGQSGAITAGALDVTASSIILNNTGNSFATAAVNSTGDASLFDASDLTISSADVDGTLTLSSGRSIGQTGAIAAGTLDAIANNGSIALTDAHNAITDASLTASGDATLYDSTNLTVKAISVGSDLTLLTQGSLDFETSVQLTNGNILAVAGWDGTTTSTSGLTQTGAYGNNGGSIVVGGTGADGDVAVGSATGSTTLAGANVSLEADNGYAQIGYHGSGGGALEVLAAQAVTLSGGSGAGDFAQIGNGGMDVSGNESGNITVKAGGAITLDGGEGADSYAQIGHGGADADKNSGGYTNTGTITVQGQTVALVAGAGAQSYTQIGHGGFDLGEGLTGKGENEGDIDVTAVDGVTLTGNGADAYAQIGNGGDHVNANATASASGSNTGSVTVDGGSGSVTMTAGVDDSSYVQIGNGGFDVNAGDNPANFSDSGTIMVSDLTLLGSNSGIDGYAQVGNGDASDNGVGDASGNITISAGKIVLTDGTATDSPALIGNQTGAGTVTGTITGFTPPPTGSTNPPPPVVGAIETTIQSQTGEPIDIIVAPPEDLLPPAGDSGIPQSTGPLAQLTGDDGEPLEGTDIATDDLGQSLSGNKQTQSVAIIPGVLTEVRYTDSPHGIPPANQDFSSWGNEALWRW